MAPIAMGANLPFGAVEDGLDEAADTGFVHAAVPTRAEPSSHSSVQDFRYRITLGVGAMYRGPVPLYRS